MRGRERWRVAHHVTWTRKINHTSAVWQYFGVLTEHESWGGKYGWGNLQIVQWKGDHKRWKNLEPKVTYMVFSSQANSLMTLPEPYIIIFFIMHGNVVYQGKIGSRFNGTKIWILPKPNLPGGSVKGVFSKVVLGIFTNLC